MWDRLPSAQTSTSQTPPATSLSAMETWAGSWPGSHFSSSPAVWLMLAAFTLHSTRAEITCASCPSPVQLHPENMELGTRAPATEEPGVLRNVRVEFREVGFLDRNVDSGDGSEMGGSRGDLPGLGRDARLDGVGQTEDATRSGAESQHVAEEEPEPAKVERGDGDAPRRGRRSPSQFPELAGNGWTGADAGAPEERGSLLDGQRPGRSEYRWNREDGRGNNRQDEPKISSGTFALTGDSAHNHAVVYWSGQNSSVSNRADPPPPTPYHHHPTSLPRCFRRCRFATSPFVTVGEQNSVTRRAERRGASTRRRAAPLRCAAANRCTGIHRCAPRRAALRVPHLCSHCELCSSADLRAQPANYARKLVFDSGSSSVTPARVHA